jgi:hypothetical protein
MDTPASWQNLIDVEHSRESMETIVVFVFTHYRQWTVSQPEPSVGITVLLSSKQVRAVGEAMSTHLPGTISGPKRSSARGRYPWYILSHDSKADCKKFSHPSLWAPQL